VFDNQNKPTGVKRIHLATLNSLRAFMWLFKNESAFKQELLLLLVAIPMTFIFDITMKEQLILILAVLFIIFTEIINTAIEAVVDRVGLEFHSCGICKFNYRINHLVSCISLKLTDFCINHYPLNEN